MRVEVVAEPLFFVVLSLLCTTGTVSTHRTGVTDKRTLNDLLVCQTDQSRMNEYETFMGNIARAHSSNLTSDDLKAVFFSRV